MNINKKVVTGFIVPALAITLVLALAVIYGSVEQEIEVKTPIEVTSYTEKITAWLGQETVIKGEPILIENVADIGDIEVRVSNEAPEGISVSYLTKLELYSKDTETWTEQGEPSEILYTIIGEDFIVENDNTGMMVINYIEPSDPYTGAFKLPEDITTSFVDEKLWLVPEDADSNDDDALDSWTPELFKFEHDVVDYTKGNSGIITLGEGESIELIPVYTIIASTIGTESITTNVENIE